MQHIVSARSEEIALRRNAAHPPPADAADKKIETFGIASLDVRRGRVMLWKPNTDAHPVIHISHFHCAGIKTGIGPGL